MVTGKVVRFDRARGYGFVAPDTGGEDVFIHANDLDMDETVVAVGTRVAFEVVAGERGPKAYDVRVLSAREPHSELAAKPAGPPEPQVDDECEVLSGQEFTGEVTELLIAAAPTLTAAQIVAIREALIGVARAHKWVD